MALMRVSDVLCGIFIVRLTSAPGYHHLETTTTTEKEKKKGPALGSWLLDVPLGLLISYVLGVWYPDRTEMLAHA